MSDQCVTCGAADVILFTCGYCDRVFCADHSLPHHSCEGLAHPGEDADEVTFEWGTGGRTPPEDPFSGSGFRAAAGSDEPAPRSPAPRSPPEPGLPAVEPAPRRPADEATAVVQPVPRPADVDATPAVERVPRRISGTAPAAVERVPRSVEGAATPAVSRVPRAVDPATPAIEVAPRTVTGAVESAVRPAPRRPPGPAQQAIEPAPDSGPTSPVGTAASTTGPATATTATGAEPGGSSSPSSTDHIRAMDAKRSPGSVERHEPRTLTEWLDQQTYVSLSVKTAALATIINGALYLGMMLTLYELVPI